jgi:large conductance mechanosensitive channel
MVNDILMPPIGMLLGNVNFTDLFLSLDGKHYESLVKATEAGAPVIRYGLFINTILDFLIVAFVIFVMIKQVNRWSPTLAAAPKK